MIFSKQNQGRKIVVCARVGGANTTPLMAAHFAKQNAKFGGRKARAGKNSSPPTPFLFARPSVSVLRAKRAIIRSFAQKMFELRPKNTAKFYIQRN